MKSDTIRGKFVSFFKENGHKQYPSSSLIPEEEDRSVLFTSAGMQQFKQWYLDESKIEVSRAVSIQKCFRTSDIDEVGDKTHHTFFEMLGNFSFGYPDRDGSYFKKEAINLAWEFLTSKKWLGIEKSKISATIFKGDENTPKDKQSKKILETIGVEDIKELGREDNFWGPVGKSGPCGPTVEFFVPGSKEPIEIWNLVFNQYYQKENGSLEELEFQGVDTGMGLERVAAYLQNTEDDYQTDLFEPAIAALSKYIDIRHWEEEARVIADHLRSVVFLISEDVLPSNTDQGYILRRLLRRVFALLKVISLGSDIEIHNLIEICHIYIEKYSDIYELSGKEKISKKIQKEYDQWSKTINKGIQEFEKMLEREETISGEQAFRLHDTYGLPKIIIKGLFEEGGINFSQEEYQEAKKKHQQISRQGATKKFKGGLADEKEMTVKLHTAAHLLHESLRRVLGDHVQQKGQNITEERLRFDFSHPEAMSDEELAKVEQMVNEQIGKDLKITSQDMPLEEAIEAGAVALFKDKYPDIVTLYSVGDFSKELCLGPHISRTGELGRFKINKEESSSKGVRRIRAVLE